MKKKYQEVYEIEKVEDIVSVLSDLGERFPEYNVSIVKSTGPLTIWKKIDDSALDIITTTNMKGNKKRILITNQLLVFTDESMEEYINNQENIAELKIPTTKEIADYIASKYAVSKSDIDDIGVIVYPKGNPVAYDCIIDKIAVDNENKSVVIIAL